MCLDEVSEENLRWVKQDSLPCDLISIKDEALTNRLLDRPTTHDLLNESTLLGATANENLRRSVSPNVRER